LDQRFYAPFSYFFLKPVGHLGGAPVTFFEVLPFTQVIVDFFGATVFVACTGCFTACSGPLKLTASEGEE
jgi:uncharacterized membrane protein